MRVTRFKPQRRWFILEIIAIELSISGSIAFPVWKSYPPIDSLLAASAWTAYLLLSAAVCSWTLTTCFDYIEIGAGVFRRGNLVGLRDTTVPLSALSGVGMRRRWPSGQTIRVGWSSGSVMIPVTILGDGALWSPWASSDARAFVSCLQQNGVPVSSDALVELNLALPPPAATSFMRYWPNGRSRGAVGDAVVAAMFIASAAALVWYNRGVPIEHWEAKAFWILWALGVLFVIDRRFEYVEIGLGDLRRGGFFALSEFKVPLARITDVRIRPGWLGIARVSVEWPDGKMEFAPIHLDPRLNSSRWTPYGIRRVVQRLRQERVIVRDEVLEELGLDDAPPEGAG